MSMIALQDKFATQVSQLVSGPWDEIRVHYENATIDGVPREVFTSKVVHEGVGRDLDLSLDAVDTLCDLKSCRPAGQDSEWTWLEFVIDRTGKYKFDYKYDDPPYIVQQIKYSN